MDDVFKYQSDAGTMNIQKKKIQKSFGTTRTSKVNKTKMQQQKSKRIRELKVQSLKANIEEVQDSINIECRIIIYFTSILIINKNYSQALTVLDEYALNIYHDDKESLAMKAEAYKLKAIAHFMINKDNDY